MSNQSSTERFAQRVENYLRSRPGYPQAVYEHIRATCRLNSSARIVDVGSGTGLLSKLFLEKGHQVIGVEPNAEMREAGEQYLGRFERFTSLEGKAEALPLPDGSADLILAGQAFHWFDPLAFRAETLRVGKAGAWAALVWNSWEPELSPFLANYDQLLCSFGTDYREVSRQHRRVQEGINLYFEPSSFSLSEFPTQQRFDFEGLQGRLLSSSYVPLENDFRHPAMLAELEALFAEHSVNGEVQFDYLTRVYLGQPQLTTAEN